MKFPTDLDWSLQYVACPSNAAQDITLESVSVGPVYVGINKFILQVLTIFIFSLPEKFLNVVSDGGFFASSLFGVFSFGFDAFFDLSCCVGGCPGCQAHSAR